MRILLISMILFPALLAGAEKMKAEEVVTAHLLSLGTPEARAAIKSRVAEGQVRMQMIYPGQGWLEGPVFVAGEGQKFRISLLFRHAEYWGEDFAFQGAKTDVGYRLVGIRTNLGAFFLSNPDLLKEGLFGGALSTAWPLLDLAGREAKLEYSGIKKISGKELHQLEYRMKKGGAVSVRLFFEPETFRHARTVYTWQRRSAVRGARAAANEEQLRTYTLEEVFDSFQSFDGITFPTRWVFRFGAQGGTRDGDFQQEWTALIEKITHNLAIDPNTYVIASPRE